MQGLTRRSFLQRAGILLASAGVLSHLPSIEKFEENPKKVFFFEQNPLARKDKYMFTGIVWELNGMWKGEPAMFSRDGMVIPRSAALSMLERSNIEVDRVNFNHINSIRILL